MTYTDRSVLLIRHGETQWNSVGRLQGRRDSPLTANGVRQALAMGQHLATLAAGHDDIRYWVSPLGRTMQTASILADLWTVPLDRFVADARLVERSYGVWEGHSFSALEAERPDQLRANDEDPWGFRMPQGESRDELTRRVGGWLARAQPGPLHVVVTHSGCLRALRGLYTAAAPEVILDYREAQTTAVLLKGGAEQLMEVPLPVLLTQGCRSSGGTVWI